MGELDREKEEEYIEDDIDDKDGINEDEDSSHRQSSVVVTLTRISKVN